MLFSFKLSVLASFSLLPLVSGYFEIFPTTLYLNLKKPNADDEATRKAAGQEGYFTIVNTGSVPIHWKAKVKTADNGNSRNMPIIFGDGVSAPAFNERTNLPFFSIGVGGVCPNCVDDTCILCGETEDENNPAPYGGFLPYPGGGDPLNIATFGTTTVLDTATDDTGFTKINFFLWSTKLTVFALQFQDTILEIMTWEDGDTIANGVTTEVAIKWKIFADATLQTLEIAWDQCPYTMLPASIVAGKPIAARAWPRDIDDQIFFTPPYAQKLELVYTPSGHPLSEVVCSMVWEEWTAESDNDLQWAGFSGFTTTSTCIATPMIGAAATVMFRVVPVTLGIGTNAEFVLSQSTFAKDDPSRRALWVGPDPEFIKCPDDRMTPTGVGDLCQCPAGTYANIGGDGVHVCAECPVGTWSAAVGATDGNTCNGCPDNMTTVGTGKVADSECACMMGFFKSDGECLECTSGMTCFVGAEDFTTAGFDNENVKLAPGYWRPLVTSTVVFECMFPDSCVGSDDAGTGSYGNSVCAEGHTGSYCDACIKNDEVEYSYNIQTGECLKCQPERRTKVVVGLAIACAVIFLLFSIVVLRTARFAVQLEAELASNLAAENEAATKLHSDEEKAQARVQRSSSINKKLHEDIDALKKLEEKRQQMMMRIQKIRDFYKSVRTPLKIFITFCQIQGGLPSGFDFKYPTSFKKILEGLSVFDFDYSAYISSACIFPESFFSGLLLQTIFPLVLGGLLIVAWKLGTRKKNAFWNAIGEECFKMFLLGTYLVMPGATKKIFQCFGCDTKIQNADSHNDSYGSYLKADFHQLCFDEDGNIDPTYAAYRIYAFIMILVYPIGITGFYCLCLWRHRFTIDPGQAELELDLRSDEEGLAQALKIRDDGPYKERHGKYAFLYEAYEPKFWWFEVFECIRRLLLTAGLMVLTPGTTVQVAVSMIVCLLSMRVYAYAAPFIVPRDDRLAEIMQWQIFFTMFGALVMKANVASEADSGYMGYLLVAINAVGPLILIIDNFVSGEVKDRMKEKFFNLIKNLRMVVKICMCCCRDRANKALDDVEAQANKMENDAAERLRDSRPAHLQLKVVQKQYQDMVAAEHHADEVIAEAEAGVELKQLGGKIVEPRNPAHVNSGIPGELVPVLNESRL